MKYFLFILFLSISLSSFAQSNYKPGYVVGLKNDTTKGFIDYKEWENNPKEFTFKSNLNQSQLQVFSVENAIAFGITGAEHFQKFIFKKTLASTNPDWISVHLDTSRVLDTSFLKTIVRGKNISLYSFTDKIKTRFYISPGKDRQLEELNYYIYYLKDNEDKYQTLYTFRYQLQDLADNYDLKDIKLSRKIEYAHYEESDIKDIAELINGGPSSQNFESGNVFGFRAFAGGGPRFNQIVTGGGNDIFFPKGTNANAVSPVISGGIDFFANKQTQRFIFRAEVELSNSHYVIPPTAINGGGTKANLDLKKFTAAFVPQVIYNFYSTENLRIFINGGLSFNFSSRNEYYYWLNFNNVSSQTQPNFPELTKYYNAARLKAGLIVKNIIEIYANHEFSAPVTPSGNYSASISFYQAGVNYLF